MVVLSVSASIRVSPALSSLLSPLLSLIPPRKPAVDMASLSNDSSLVLMPTTLASDDDGM